MKIMQVGELKAKFSKVLEDVQQGEEVVISRGRKKEHIAVIVPFSEYKEKNRVRLGSLEGKASYKVKKGYEMTLEEMIDIWTTSSIPTISSGAFLTHSKMNLPGARSGVSAE